eukprot:TRINITY_DN11973_c1_g1_i1.p1 TRINITY_DN11973_c1_g1~~TRINITY_DN11973_c1_g1_i1.p1  ORF type:complete len:151 (+),score=5.10 TRINITY_DN11973_c1_g1_i1:154-606(+)
MPCTYRILKEFQDLANDPPAQISAGPIHPNDLFKWSATIIGPPQSPFANGIFKLSINLPHDYPFNPPQIKFLTKIYHPNISTKGDICMDILDHRWSSTITLQTLLLSVCVLLTEPNPAEPLVPSVARVYKNNKEKYERIAREWTSKYAMI